MSFDDRVDEVSPELLEATTSALVGRLSDPIAKNDSFNAGEWWLLHPDFMKFLDAIVPQIQRNPAATEAEKTAGVAGALFTLRVIGEYFDTSDAEAVLSGLRLE